MKILLVCGGGLSSSILMKNMKSWAESNDADLEEVLAIGQGELEKMAPNYDCVLVAPQIAHAYKIMREQTDKPLGKIPPLDYAMGNGENVYKFAEKLLEDSKV